MKLPNAEQPLGTNETDSLSELWLRDPWARGSWGLGAGLLIAGHPHQLAAQDDALVLRAQGTVAFERASGDALLAADWRVRSARNPGDASVALGWEQKLGDSKVVVGAEGRVGLTPAAADFAGSLWLGLVPGPFGA